MQNPANRKLMEMVRRAGTPMRIISPVASSDSNMDRSWAGKT